MVYALDLMNAVFLFPFEIKNVAWQYFPIVTILVLLAYMLISEGRLSSNNTEGWGEYIKKLGTKMNVVEIYQIQ